MFTMLSVWYAASCVDISHYSLIHELKTRLDLLNYFGFIHRYQIKFLNFDFKPLLGIFGLGAGGEGKARKKK